MRAAPLALAAVLLASGCFGGGKKTELHCGPPAVCGDVDGDGAKDEVRIEGRRLIVRTGDDEFTLKVATRDRPPFVNGLAAIDRRRGLEIVATLEYGASTAFASVFGMHGGRLIRFTLPASAPQPSFAYGGTVTHFDGVDCARPGVVVATSISEATVGERTYEITKTRFRLVGTRKSKQRPGSNPVFADPAFPSCMEIRPVTPD
jgi:hypothetical protein